MGFSIVQFNGNQGVILYDAAGNALLIQNGVAIPASTPLVPVGGSDAGGVARFLKTDTGGNLRVDPTGTTTQPVSSTQLPAALSALGNLKVAVSESGGSTIGLVDQGLPNASLAQGWPVKVTDGTNVLGTAANPVRVDPTGTTRQPGVLYDSSGNAVRVLNDGGVYRLSVDAKIAAGGASQQVLPVDSNGVALPVADGAAVGSTYGLVVVGKDTTTPALRMMSVDTQGRLVTAPPGTVSTTAGFKMGYVATAATADVAVRATVYTEQTSDAQRSVVSANAADSGAGTGARQVKLSYYTAAGLGPYEETLTLNGTTAVNTVATNICYIEKLAVTSVGSGGSNAGIISLKAATGGGGVTIWSIAVGDNRTFGAHHYTAAGLTTYITGMSIGHSGTVVGSGGMFVIRARSGFATTVPNIQVSDFIRLYGQSSTISRTYGTPIVLVGPAVIAAYVKPESTSALIYRAAFDYYDQ